MAVEPHADPVACFVFDLGTELLQQVYDLLEVDIGADRMREHGVESFAVTVVHDRCNLYGGSGQWLLP
jgi:hypothetical protein